jgi:hypothetical protein
MASVKRKCCCARCNCVSCGSTQMPPAYDALFQDVQTPIGCFPWRFKGSGQTSGTINGTVRFNCRAGFNQNCHYEPASNFGVVVQLFGTNSNCSGPPFTLNDIAGTLDIASNQGPTFAELHVQSGSENAVCFFKKVFSVGANCSAFIVPFSMPNSVNVGEGDQTAVMSGGTVQLTPVFNPLP